MPARAWAPAPPPPATPAAPPALKVMSFNILAEEYTADNFGYCPPQYLAWGHRLKQILLEILRREPDVLCLQEVSSRAHAKQLAPFLAKRGYRAVYMKKHGKEEVEGLAIFHNERTTVLLEARRFVLAELARDSRWGRKAQQRGSPAPTPSLSSSPAARSPSAASPAATPSSPSSAAAATPAAGWSPREASGFHTLWRRLEGMPQVALAAVIAPRAAAGAAAGDGGGDDDVVMAGASGAGAMPSPSATGAAAGSDDDGLPSLLSSSGRGAEPAAHPPLSPAQQALVVTNFHAYWSPKWPEVKALQVALAVDATDALRREVNARYRRADTGVLFVGDLNTMPIIRAPTEYDGAGPFPLVPGVYSLLSTGSLRAEHPHHPVARRAPAHGRTDVPPLHPTALPHLELPLRFASAYVAAAGAEPAWTNWHTHDFIEALDYIWVATHERSAADEGGGGGSSSSAAAVDGDDDAAAWQPLPRVPVPVAVLMPPSGDDVRALDGGGAGGCPNEGIPSDHIPLVAALALLTP
jgi:hypothetical protein